MQEVLPAEHAADGAALLGRLQKIKPVCEATPPKKPAITETSAEEQLSHYTGCHLSYCNASRKCFTARGLSVEDCVAPHGLRAASSFTTFEESIPKTHRVHYKANPLGTA